MKKLLLLSVLFSFMGCEEKNEQPEITRESVLIDLAKAETLERLKSPSTAVFIDSLSSIFKMKDASAYQVRLSVDAQNSLRATSRERYFVIFNDKGGDSLSPANYELNQFIE